MTGPFAVVVLSFVSTFKANLSVQDTVRDWDDVNSCGHSCGAAICDTLESRMTDDMAEHDSSEADLIKVAEHWGFSEFSMRALLSKSMQSGMHRSLGLSVCEWRNTLLSDRVHTSRTGNLLIADYLVQQLQAAKDAIGMLVWPTAPLYSAAFDMPPRKCIEARALPRAVHPTCADDCQWGFVDSELIHGERVMKPGLMASVPFSRVMIRVNTFFHMMPRADVILSIMYLRSYEHMGRVRVGCERGCTCAPLDIDAHDEERVSVSQLAELKVTQHRECILSLTVLPDTSSGSNKWKLLGLEWHADITALSSEHLRTLHAERTQPVR